MNAFMLLSWCHVSGLEADGGDRFFCGGGSSGKVRAVRRPKPDQATKSRAAGG
jgi:hypothetical protein